MDDPPFWCTGTALDGPPSDDTVWYLGYVVMRRLWQRIMHLRFPDRVGPPGDEVFPFCRRITRTRGRSLWRRGLIRPTDAAGHAYWITPEGYALLGKAFPMGAGALSSDTMGRWCQRVSRGECHDAAVFAVLGPLPEDGPALQSGNPEGDTP